MRDVISAEMWEAINTTHLRLRDGDFVDALAVGPVLAIYQHVKERSALFWGLTARTMLRDEASAFLNAGGRIEAGDMVLRMLRVALPVVPEGNEADGQAIALLQAVGGFQAYRRAVPAPRARQARRALPALRAQLPRLGRGGRRRRQRVAADRRRAAAQLRADPAAQPPERRPRVPPQRGDATPTCASPARRSSASSGSSTPTSRSGTLAARAPPP